MGIVDQKLATFELTGFESCYIERNVNDSIHLHMDGIRIELSAREFAHFVAVITEARDALLEQKGRGPGTEGPREVGTKIEIVDAGRQ